MIPVRDLMRRLAVAIVGIPLVFFVLYQGGWILTGLLAVIAVMATRELYALASAKGTRAFYLLGTAGALALVLLAGWVRAFEPWAPWALGVLMVLFFLASASAVGSRGPDDRPLFVASLTGIGALYWGAGFSFAVFLRHMPETTGWPESASANQGLALLAFPFAVTWLADTAAYLFGHAFGRRKLAPRVSPGKTVVGGVAGLVTSILSAAILAWAFLDLHPSPILEICLGGSMGVLMGVTIQMGDLIESLFKREAGVKDSASLLPGHGGVLDRFDALVFTIPLTYGLLRLVGILT